MRERFQAIGQFHIATTDRDDLAESYIVQLLDQRIGNGAPTSMRPVFDDGYQVFLTFQSSRFELGECDVRILGFLGTNQPECVFFQPANGMFQQTFVDMPDLFDIQSLVGK